MPKTGYFLKPPKRLGLHPWSLAAPKLLFSYVIATLKSWSFYWGTQNILPPSAGISNTNSYAIDNVTSFCPQCFFFWRRHCWK